MQPSDMRSRQQWTVTSVPPTSEYSHLYVGANGLENTLELPAIRERIDPPTFREALFAFHEMTGLTPPVIQERSGLTARYHRKSLRFSLAKYFESKPPRGRHPVIQSSAFFRLGGLRGGTRESGEARIPIALYDVQTGLLMLNACSDPKTNSDRAIEYLTAAGTRGANMYTGGPGYIRPILTERCTKLKALGYNPMVKRKGDRGMRVIEKRDIIVTTGDPWINQLMEKAERLGLVPVYLPIGLSLEEVQDKRDIIKSHFQRIADIKDTAIYLMEQRALELRSGVVSRMTNPLADDLREAMTALNSIKDVTSRIVRGA